VSPRAPTAPLPALHLAAPTSPCAPRFHVAAAWMSLPLPDCRRSDCVSGAGGALFRSLPASASAVPCGSSRMNMLGAVTHDVLRACGSYDPKHRRRHVCLASVCCLGFNDAASTSCACVIRIMRMGEDHALADGRMMPLSSMFCISASCAAHCAGSARR